MTAMQYLLFLNKAHEVAVLGRSELRKGMKEGGYEDCMATFDSNHNTIYASFSKVQSLRTLGHNDQKSELLDVRLDCVKPYKKTRKTVEIDFFYW